MSFRSLPITRHSRYRINRTILLSGLALAGLALVAQLIWLTTVRSSSLSDQAEANLHSDFRLSPPRGNIVDRHGVVLATNRRTYAVTYSPYGQRDAAARSVLQAIAAHAGVPTPDEIDRILATRPRWTRHTLLRRAGHDEVLPLLERPADFPGVRVQADYVREYTYPITMSHLIGYLSRIMAEDGDRFARPRYQPDDEVGRSGLERALEDRLAGHPGRERQRRDARRRLLGDPVEIEPARAGQDVTLTIDVRLQQRAMDLLHGQQGSIIVLDAQTGEVIVMASWPAFDPRRPGLATVEGAPASFFNRALRGQFPPGSTFKIVGATAAQRHGIAPTETLLCEGSFRPPGWDRAFWCNVRTGHGPVNLAQSLKYSCNVYYYRLAERLTPTEWLEAARGFGYGTPTGIDLPGEVAGRLPDLQTVNAGERTNFSIGQGSMLATPLQVVVSFAALINGGRLPVPRVLADTPSDPARWRRIPASPDQIAAINAGLWRVVNERGGTAFKAGIPSQWGVSGKTGTAENAAGGTDAWFAGFYPAPEPRFAFVIHLEEINQHGGDAAAPVARDLIGYHRELMAAPAPAANPG